MTLSKNDPKIEAIEISYGPNRGGDILHTLASIKKAKRLIQYSPLFDINIGLENAVNWYFGK